MGLREAKRGKNEGQEAPQERPRGPKRATVHIGPDPNVVILDVRGSEKDQRSLKKAAMLAADWRLQDWKDWRLRILRAVGTANIVLGHA